MKSIALNSLAVPNHQVGFWNLVRTLFQSNDESGVRDSGIPFSLSDSSEEALVFFSHEYELEDYIRSFRE